MRDSVDIPTCRHRQSRFSRLLEFLGFGSCEHVYGDFLLDDHPPDAPSGSVVPGRAPGGAVTLQLPDVD
jgi:hypothetical protein